MKKLLGFVILVAALILGSYFGMGLLTERAIKKNIDVLNQTSGVNVQLESYHRGLFRSDAMLIWKLIPNAENTNTARPVVLHVPLNIDHGPIIFSGGRILFGLGHAESTVMLPVENIKSLAANSVKPSLHLSIFVSYFNKTSIDVVIPKFDMVTTQGNMHLDSKGMNVHIHISATRKQIQGEWFIDSSTWAKDQVQIALDQVKSKYYLNLTHTGLSVGEADVSVPYLSIAQSGQKVLEVKQMDLQSKNGIVKGLFNASLKANIQALILNKKTYAANQLALEIKNLDAAILVQMNNKLSKIDQTAPSAQQQIIFSLLSDLPNLVSKGAELQLSDFNVITPDGPITASASLVFPKESVANPFQLIQKIKGTGKVDISVSALKALMRNALEHEVASTQANAGQSSAAPAVIPPAILAQTPNTVMADINTRVEQKIQSLVQQGVLVLNGDKYSSEFDFTDGTLKINGKSFSPSMLQ